MKRSDFKPALTDERREKTKRKMLEILRNVSTYDDERCNKVETIADHSGVKIETARLFLKHMKAQGLIEKTYLVDDEGLIRGSGYVQTLAGEKCLRS